MRKILIGTGNRGKQYEYLRIVKTCINCDVSIVFPLDIGITQEPVETGRTFEENALLKAKYYFKASGIPSLADDGGMEIPILNNEPGVISRRWKGYEMSDEEIIQYTLKRMSSYTRHEERRAYLTVTLAYYDGIHVMIEKESVRGYIAEKPLKKGTKGYPFRRFFIVEGTGTYYEELTQEEHQKYNHREKAFIKLLKRLR